MDLILVWLPQQTLQAQQYALHVVDRAPLVLQNVQAYPPTEIEIWVVDGCLEQHYRRGIWIVRWELEGKLEGQAGVWCICGANDGARPIEEIFWRGGEGGDARGRREHELHEFGL